MIIYLNRWKLKPGKEEQFQKAWSYVTEQLRDKSGSLGSSRWESHLDEVANWIWAAMLEKTLVN